MRAETGSGIRSPVDIEVSRKRKRDDKEEGQLEHMTDSEPRRKTPTSPKTYSRRDSLRDPEYIPSRYTPKIDDNNPQEIEKAPINESLISCFYVSIPKQYVPVSKEILQEMKSKFGDKMYHVTHVLADEKGYYVLFDNSKYGNQDAIKFCDAFRAKRLEGGHPLTLFKHRSCVVRLAAPPKSADCWRPNS